LTQSAATSPISPPVASPAGVAVVHRRPVVVGFGGTTRADSSTARALAIALDVAEQHGAETSLFTANDIALPLYDPDAPLDERALRFIAEVRRADGVIIASPGYHGGPSGLVKNALDHLEELRNDARPYLHGLGVGCIVCASGWQAATTTLTSLRSTVHALRGWPTPLGVAINSLDSNGAGEDGFGDSVQRQLEILGEQVVTFATQATRAR
jgi:FMN reductase